MQVSGLGIAETVSATSKEGIAAFWKGIVFAYGREISYTSIKLGAYGKLCCARNVVVIQNHPMDSNTVASSLYFVSTAPVRDAIGAGPDGELLSKP